MGLLQLGTPLAWPEAKQAANQVREWGIEQLLTIWRKAKVKERDALLWGDEIEYLVVAIDDQQKKVRLSLCQADVLKKLANDHDLAKQGTLVPDLQDTILPDLQDNAIRSGSLPTFHPEFGRFMLEATPGKPWGIGFKDLLDVESDMKNRRVIAKQHMDPDQYPITLTTFPRLGTRDDYITPYYPPSGPALRSQFVPDEIANPHIRFPTLAANIRSRRGRKVELNVPVFKDKNTPNPFHDPTVNHDLHIWPEDDDVRNGAAKENCVYMDAMAFGMGSCCLQITFQAKNIREGRTLYDQLSPLGPVLLALTAATPIYKGFLVDTDVRWNQISRAVDDRTPGELGEKPLKDDRWRIPKSRYASNSTYIAQDPRLRPEYMDPNLIVDERLKQKLLDGGMDDLLATHFAHLFIRDPLVIFSEDLKVLDPEGSNHFENIQSTNWQHMRFKPPPPDADIGWRVEFRSMEIQITDFENAAFAIFIVLVTRAILSFDLNFYIPIPLTTENMETAHARDAVMKEKFWFRKDPFPRRSPKASPTLNGVDASKESLGPVEDEYRLMTIDEIINGTSSSSSDEEDYFPGLIPLVESYLDSVNIDVTTRCELARYLDLIRNRANGTLWTGAKWLREFVRSHPEYKHDSEVSEHIVYDMFRAVDDIGKNEGRKGWMISMA
ncbi:glutamate--cysteine ligase [Elasticomyces elasticus]|uniref:Glutamate--cysteine ligase n=1 Tax=Exophiala sideris TaxID=1016849 RepID=A0ABR0JPY3_9EURO|nr:glutamate--cysteine ligase [Elasticomyces elasticus]KAK5039658.1 glutamate--cysteine ligase [Exophiala sideris]KAK5041210.1 glutamate--cysteine ligase [Exophiala sideris]KAK5068035.1 glutamate--cysteine ligase [Exophiala sideris]KAK5187337.1 glutamate--cysteine ligase [Eurotiomycetes sp. CCFEE 6388]